jgi:Asp-tRNA(Asn)/Glu-tRNA(Gln) amidotransferase A subunit family amidase
VALPYRQGARDLPLSVQVVAARDTDDDLLDAAAWVEQALAPA